MVKNCWVQGRSESNPELLDAAALCRQLVADGSGEAFLADHRHDLFPDQMFEDLFPSGRGRPSILGDGPVGHCCRVVPEPQSPGWPLR
jgi:hypothetical protein